MARLIRRWAPRAPHFRVSIDLREGPDLLCTLQVQNPGPAFILHHARLLSPQHGLIYQRDSFLSSPLLPKSFSDWVINEEVPRDQVLRLPFELWIPSWDPEHSIRIAIHTSRRRRGYRCRIGALGPRAES